MWKKENQCGHQYQTESIWHGAALPAAAVFAGRSSIGGGPLLRYLSYTDRLR